ncbi:IMP-specific 5'-nucleotidase 1 [Rasamsonia emersonii CBS 393.64]|uniref:IMP-specific 5'-nucleotidase 1 n=1 Tax=Rasamsonia emersonii (strain ATCC 16479 / CBS 393.64 / IMI 116815) TaxID=1408163 RepID=A0A0F4YVJ0_RASE3|nr:IMP-specific 5'-nucleotidase 1 [Rasamsonia emersonii CBS 393.64]KKA22312.1 IMP-specific 5'-nucleotidase 1 [Rasamsonia emersonii CBS 393.64]
MTTRYRVEYALKSHRRDQLGLLAVPFVLHSQPTAIFNEESAKLAEVARATHQRYAEIMRDVEQLVNDHSKLIPLMGLIRRSKLRLVTFDGDVTLYEDGCCLLDGSPVIPRLIRLLQQGKKVGIVTAAGYTDASKYYGRLKGLLDAVSSHPGLTDEQKNGLVVLGGESNFLFRYNQSSPDLLTYVERSEWMLDEMRLWRDEDITELLDVAEASLRECVSNLNLPAAVLRKERAVGIYPLDGHKMHREQLEETVLVVQSMVEKSEVGRRLPFCAFNGGNDVFVDIGDKSWGVRACQRYFGGIDPSMTLHVGDQFLSAGANDFKARLACTTAWIASPTETVQLLDELAELEGRN